MRKLYLFCLVLLPLLATARPRTVESTFSNNVVQNNLRVMGISDTTYKDLIHMYFKQYKDSSCTQRTAKVVAIPVNTCLKYTGSFPYIKWIPSDTDKVKSYRFSGSSCDSSTASSTIDEITITSCYLSSYTSTKSEYLQADSLMVVSGEVPRSLIIPDIFGLTGSQSAFSTYATSTSCKSSTTAGSQEYQRIMSYGTDGECYYSESGSNWFTAENNNGKITITHYTDSSCTAMTSSVDYAHNTCTTPSTTWGSNAASVEAFAHINGWALVAILCFVFFLICCFLGLIPVVGCVFIIIAIWMLIWAIEGKNSWDDKGSETVS